MNRKISVLGFVAAMTVLMSSLAMAAPDKKDYQSTPFWVAEPSIPQVLIIMSREYKMFYQAYAGLIVDFDGDGRIDTGFNPNAEYTGYFDPRSCYVYKASHEGQSLASSRWTYADPNAYFERAGATIDDDATIARPSSLKGYIPSPRSVTGICRGVTSGGKKTFSGNWLNFMTSSRMDVIRKILYGGDRVVDSATQTYLEASFVPPDAAVWGTDIFADNIWNKTPYNAYYDITKYTPFDKPADNKAHYFARVRDTGEGQLFPSLRMAVNVTIGSNDRRYWDWVMQSRPVPNDNQIHSYVTSYKSFRVKVKVCDASNMEDAAYGCQLYPSGVYKPVGLLQEYGESEKMYFGLMTGGFSETMRKKGGILRNHVDSIGKSINSSTGQLLQYGLPWSISQLRISGRWLNTYDYSAGCASSVCLYADHNSWGNPLGEMLYEGVRYMASKSSPTSSFASGEVGDRSKTFFGASRVPSEDSPINKLLTRNSLSSWNGRPSLAAGDCVKPVILLISDIDSSYDGDDIPDSNDLNSAVLLAGSKLDSRVTLPQQFKMGDYLDAITKLEGYGGTTKYLIAKKRTDDCSAKSMSSLKEVKGICPSAPSYEGTFSIAAVAYYAHTHNFNPSGVATGIDIYAVTMSAAFPELTFNIPTSAGEPDPSRKISVLPVNITSLNNTNPYTEINTDRILSYINYFLYDWQLDKNGIPFSITIRVNFSDRSMADDWEMDVVQEYRVNLLTDSSTPASDRSTCAINREGTTCGTNLASAISGVYRNTAGNYYYFKNPDTAQSTSDFIEIKPSQVKGLSVESRFIQNASGGPLGMGYTISGSTHDGSYIENSLGTWTPASSFNTPPTCYYTGGANGVDGNSGCGQTHNTTRQIRTFNFADNTNIQALPSPLWLAAKYGGFSDLNNNGVPDDNEWKRGGTGSGKDDPANFFQATNISDLAVQLGDAFQAIADSALTGTANSASINSVLGGGQSIQTQYYTKYEDPTDSNNNLIWTGSVYSLFVDKWGNLREDTNGNGKLDLITSPAGAMTEIGDLIVDYVATPGQTKPTLARYRDVKGNNTWSDEEIVNSYTDLKTIWDVAERLSMLSDSQVKASRAYNAVGGRRVYSFYDASKVSDGSVGWSTSGVNLSGFLFNESKAPQLRSFLRQSTEAEAKALINYTLGVDSSAFRNRTAVLPWSGGVPKVWRLGDVMNSKPIIVGEASGNYHLIYNDTSFASYRSQVAKRRQMAYFGSNDGLLHAINLGYFGSLSDGQAGYAKQRTGGDTAHELGTEVWAYIPTSVLPHLAWLADPEYDHSYYVDLKPYIMDIKDESGLTSKWRTVMVVGLRLGGRTINMAADGDTPEYSYSEFFALDITDPDSEPVLMWRFSHQNLGLSTAAPTVVRGKGGNWYVVLPSGPTSDIMDGTGRMIPQPTSGETNAAYEGRSTQRARLFVLDALTGKMVNVPAANENDDKLVVKEEKSFFNDTFTPRATYVDNSGTDVTWSNHTIYIGLTALDGTKDSGAVYRLKMADSAGNPLDVADWELKRLIQTDKPVTGAVNSAYDHLGNLWVVFGTGRVWGKGDLNPCGLDESNIDAGCCDNHTQYVFGVKEPLSSNGHLTFAELPNDSRIADFSGIKVYADDTIVYASGGSVYPPTTHTGLRSMTTSKTAGYTGYKRKLDASVMLNGVEPSKIIYEMVVTQPKIDGLVNGGSNMIYTSYLTSKEICDPAGESFLNVVDTFTGLPAAYMKAYGFQGGDELTVNGVTTKQVTGVKYAGKGPASEAWILKTGEGTVYGNTSFNGTRNTIFLQQDQSQASNVISWREVLNMGFDLSLSDMLQDLNP